MGNEWVSEGMSSRFLGAGAPPAQSHTLSRQLLLAPVPSLMPCAARLGATRPVSCQPPGRRCLFPGRPEQGPWCRLSLELHLPGSLLVLSRGPFLLPTLPLEETEHTSNGVWLGLTCAVFRDHLQLWQC